MRFFAKIFFLLVIGAFIFTSQAGAQYNSNKILDFLTYTFNQYDDNVNDYLIEELEHYIEIFPRGANAAEAQYLIARVYERKGKNREAVISFIKTLLLYPRTERHEECVSAARALLSTKKTFKNKNDKVLAVVDSSFSGENQSDRYYSYLRFLIDLDESGFYKWNIKEVRTFVRRYPDYGQTATVLKWTADVYYRDKKYHEAKFGNLKLEYVYPKDPILASSRYSGGIILSSEFGEHAKAIEVFHHSIDDFPKSDYAAKSLYASGEIKYKKMKDYDAAIIDFRKVVDAYPKSDKAIDALFVIAEISADRFKDYNTALSTYQKIVEKYTKNPRGALALEDAGNIYKRNLALYTEAAEQFAKISEIYPQDPKAPGMLIRAGELCESKLKDYNKAISYYEVVIQKYPKSKKANEANKKIARAKDKLAKEAAKS